MSDFSKYNVGDKVYMVLESTYDGADKFGGGYDGWEGETTIDHILPDGRIIIKNFIFNAEGECLSGRNARLYDIGKNPIERYYIIYKQGQGFIIKENPEWIARYGKGDKQ